MPLPDSADEPVRKLCTDCGHVHANLLRCESYAIIRAADERELAKRDAAHKKLIAEHAVVKVERDELAHEVERLTKENHRLRAAERLADAEMVRAAARLEYELRSNRVNEEAFGDANDAVAYARDDYRKLKGSAP